MRRAALLGGALALVALDRLSKWWVASNVDAGAPTEILGSLVRLARGENRGGLFGLLQGSAPVLALLSIGVVLLLVALHERERASRPTLATLAFAALIGGAIGNLIDRLTLGYVLDFVDLGIGTMRFWTFNVADMGISLGILLLVGEALLPARLSGARR